MCDKLPPRPLDTAARIDPHVQRQMVLDGGPAGGNQARKAVATAGVVHLDVAKRLSEQRQLIRSQRRAQPQTVPPRHSR
jgi:hypothetical protein